jgi:hypothetical protein
MTCGCSHLLRRIRGLCWVIVLLADLRKLLQVRYQCLAFLAPPQSVFFFERRIFRFQLYYDIVHIRGIRSQPNQVSGPAYTK